jgi:hypothetical protein
MVSNDDVCKFCVYGASPQTLFSNKKVAAAVTVPSIESDSVFRTPWYCCGTPESGNGVEAFGSLTNRSRVKISAVLKKTFGTAQRLSSSKGSVEGALPMRLRFSRQCTTSSLLRGDLGEPRILQENGGFVCLCRVLLCKVMTVINEPTDEDILKAVTDSYDSILCSST